MAWWHNRNHQWGALCFLHFDQPQQHCIAVRKTWILAVELLLKKMTITDGEAGWFSLPQATEQYDPCDPTILAIVRYGNIRNIAVGLCWKLEWLINTSELVVKLVYNLYDMKSICSYIIIWLVVWNINWLYIEFISWTYFPNLETQSSLISPLDF